MPRRTTMLIPFVACALLQASIEGHQAAGTTTGAIGGKLTDTSGAVLPWVRITLSSEAVIGNDGTRATVTGADGLYRFPALPPGEYSLLFSLKGFTSVSRVGVYVGVGFTATVNIMLEVGAVTHDVTVEHRSPVIDTHSTAIATRFDASQLASLPGSRSTFAILTATPAVQVAHFEVGGSSGDSGAPYSAYGTRGANRPMVEGINVAGIFPTGFTLDYGSFSEVSVGTAVHGAEWPVPGVQMQFISKSGGNQYHGAVYADYEAPTTGSRSTSTRVKSPPEPQGGGALSPREANRLWSYHDLNADVGGYIRPDRLWWYSSFRKQNVSARQVNFPVKPLETHLLNYTAKGTYQMNPSNKLIFFAQSGHNHQPNLARWIYAQHDGCGQSGGGIDVQAARLGMDLESRVGLRPQSENALRNSHGRVRHRPAGETEPNGTHPALRGCRHVRRPRRKPRLAGEPTQQPGARFRQLFQGWLVRQPPFQGRWRDVPNDVTDIWRKGYPGDVLHVLRNGEPAEVYLFQTPSIVGKRLTDCTVDTPAICGDSTIG